MTATLRDAFRDSDEAEAGDERLVERAIDGLLARQRRGRGAGPRMLLVAAAFLLFGAGLASGSLLLRWRSSDSDPRGESWREGPRARPREVRRTTPATSMDEALLPAPASAATGSASASPANVPLLPESGVGSPSSAGGPSSGSRAPHAAGIAGKKRGAAEEIQVARIGFVTRPEASRPLSSNEREPARLFADALRARSAGDAAAALAAFRELSSRFPESPEAVLSFVSQGSLLLERNDALAALAAYESYLQAAPSGALVPEAMVGKAAALSRLGRADEARDVRRALTARFPASPYAAGAPSPRTP